MMGKSGFAISAVIAAGIFCFIQCTDSIQQTNEGRPKQAAVENPTMVDMNQWQSGVNTSLLQVDAAIAIRLKK